MIGESPQATAIMLQTESKMTNLESSWWSHLSSSLLILRNPSVTNEQHHLPCSHNSLAFSSSGGMVDVRVSFTAIQREELERQWILPLFLHIPFSQFPRTH
ncbi:uncharacterized protein LOC126619795 [Malus sylvestris]|uniref:uncharacterized protein LOC126619795 n=1 Tax=Malus sylvestris TaxID=3752 RepID=UPI0021ACCCD9|nr:uncharacterized protein LOC126619795 [Malus sylvestris]